MQKNGGNVASYFCTPDGRVVHAVTGPVPARALLDAARWAVETFARTGGDPALMADAHREAGLFDLEGPGAGGAQRRVHRLLAEQPLPPLNDVYRTVFESILGQRISEPADDLAQAELAFAAARRAKLPLLLILHPTRDNAGVLRRWGRTVDDGGGPLARLARSYVVVALPLDELPALSGRLRVAPYAAPDRGSPLFVVTRSNGRQLDAVTTWGKTDDLAFALAEGVVQEAKEHDRSPDQLRTLLNEVGPVDQGLARVVRRLLADARALKPRPAGAAKREM